MDASKHTNDMYEARFVFIEALSREFVAMTGCGVYVYLNPNAVDQLFNRYLSVDMPIRAFARQYIRSLA